MQLCFPFYPSVQVRVAGVRLTNRARLLSVVDDLMLVYRIDATHAIEARL